MAKLQKAESMTAMGFVSRANGRVSGRETKLDAVKSMNEEHSRLAKLWLEIQYPTTEKQNCAMTNGFANNQCSIAILLCLLDEHIMRAVDISNRVPYVHDSWVWSKNKEN